MATTLRSRATSLGLATLLFVAGAANAGGVRCATDHYYGSLVEALTRDDVARAVASVEQIQGTYRRLVATGDLDGQRLTAAQQVAAANVIAAAERITAAGTRRLRRANVSVQSVYELGVAVQGFHAAIGEGQHVLPGFDDVTRLYARNLRLDAPARRTNR